MDTYGSGRDEPPTELELEEERAGYEPEGSAQTDELFASPVAGIRPDDRFRRHPAPESDDPADESDGSVL
jgi:hypothetical protein